MVEKVESKMDEGTVSQDDIDSLMESASPNDSPSHEKTDEKEDAMSSNDIEKLLLNASEESVAPDVASKDVVSNSAVSKDDLSNDPEPGEDDGITLEDVDRIIDIVLETDIDVEVNDVQSKTEDSLPEEDNSSTDESGPNSDDETGSPTNSITDEPDAEDTETISQDSIDDLVNSVPDKDAAESDTDEPNNIDEVVSQGDIDSLLDGTTEEDSSENSEAEVVSQDDIDSLLQGIETEDQENKETAESQGEEPELVSQGDIDSLLDGTTEEDSSENSEAEVISQDDIENLFEEAGNELSPNEEEKGDEKKERSHLIDQGELDQLLKDFEKKDSQETEDEKSAPESGDEESKNIDEDTVLVSQDEINKLIGDIRDEPDPEETGQEDPLEHAKSDDVDAISQDDIDALLKIPEEESDEDLEDIPDVDNSDKVILEAEKEDEAGEEAQKIIEKKWYKNRYVIAGAASFFIISCTSLFLYTFLTPEADEETKKIMPSASLGPNVQESVGPSVSKTDNLVNLKDFIVMAPLDRKDITLITTHVSITLKDEVSADLIRQNKAFFRGIVYNTVRKSLVPEEQKKTVNELILTSGIKVALNKALPEASVQKVILNDLNLI